MATRRSLGSIIFDTLNVAFMIILCCIMIYPLLRVLAISVSEPDYIAAGQVNMLPRGFNILGYKTIIGSQELWRSYRNTVVYAASGTFFMLLFTSMVAYSLSAKDFVFKKPMTIYLAITMFFSGGLIPTYLWIRTIGLLDTLWVMVIPGSVSAFTVVVFRTFFQSLPYELRESAHMDGANDLVILVRIVLPLSLPLLATFGLFSVVGHWNSWFNALVYLSDRTRYPLQILLRRIVVQAEMHLENPEGVLTELVRNRYMHPKNVQMAVVVVSLVPVLCIYPFVQKYFAKGVMIGAIKG